MTYEAMDSPGMPADTLVQAKLSSIQHMEAFRVAGQHHRSLAAVLDALAGTWSFDERAAILDEARVINETTRP